MASWIYASESTAKSELLAIYRECQLPGTQVQNSSMVASGSCGLSLTLSLTVNSLGRCTAAWRQRALTRPLDLRSLCRRKLTENYRRSFLTGECGPSAAMPSKYWWRDHGAATVDGQTNVISSSTRKRLIATVGCRTSFQCVSGPPP